MRPPLCLAWLLIIFLGIERYRGEGSLVKKIVNFPEHRLVAKFCYFFRIQFLAWETIYSLDASVQHPEYSTTHMTSRITTIWFLDTFFKICFRYSSGLHSRMLPRMVRLRTCITPKQMVWRLRDTASDTNCFYLPCERESASACLVLFRNCRWHLPQPQLEREPWVTETHRCLFQAFKQILP